MGEMLRRRLGLPASVQSLSRSWLLAPPHDWGSGSLAWGEARRARSKMATRPALSYSTEWLAGYLHRLTHSMPRRDREGRARRGFATICLISSGVCRGVIVNRGWSHASGLAATASLVKTRTKPARRRAPKTRRS